MQSEYILGKINAYGDNTHGPLLNESWQQLLPAASAAGSGRGSPFHSLGAIAMKRIQPLVYELKDRELHVAFSCIDKEGAPDEAVSATLLDLIEMSCWAKSSRDELCELVRRAEAGQYISPNSQLPDFGFNDVNIWLAPPMAPSGMLTITNENTIYDSESKNLQHFTFSQFWTAFNFWQKVSTFVLEHGIAALQTHHLEAPLV